MSLASLFGFDNVTGFQDDLTTFQNLPALIDRAMAKGRNDKRSHYTCRFCDHITTVATEAQNHFMHYHRTPQNKRHATCQSCFAAYTDFTSTYKHTCSIPEPVFKSTAYVCTSAPEFEAAVEIHRLISQIRDDISLAYVIKNLRVAVLIAQ